MRFMRDHQTVLGGRLRFSTGILDENDVNKAHLIGWPDFLLGVVVRMLGGGGIAPPSSNKLRPCISDPGISNGVLKAPPPGTHATI